MSCDGEIVFEGTVGRSMQRRLQGLWSEGCRGIEWERRMLLDAFMLYDLVWHVF